MPTLAFFPWASISEPLQFGEFELLSFEEASRRGIVPAELVAAVDTILESYDRKRPIDRAKVPLLFRSGAEATSDIDEEKVDDYFAFRKRLAFSALAQRSFFGHRYCCSEHLRLVIQMFSPEKAGSSLVTTRRRDGATRAYYSAGTHRTPRPPQVSGSCELPKDLDCALLAGLEVAARESASWDAIGESVDLFVGANTDSDDVGIHGELVDIVSAFSRIANGWDEDKTAAGFVWLLPPKELMDDLVGPYAADALVMRDRNTGRSMREAWLRSAYRVRSQFGHGRVAAPPYRSAWSPREHLLLGAVALPLTIKAILVREGLYSFSRRDEALDYAFDTLTTLAPFSQSSDDEDYPWQEVMNRATLRPLAEAMATSLAAFVEQNPPAEASKDGAVANPESTE